MKTILCYGDSNTWGAMPHNCKRFPIDVRWTGLLQEKLGSECRILEAGLNGRTTIWDDPYDPYLNGEPTLKPTVLSSSPLDLVVLMLGTNDLKWKTAWEAARGANHLVEIIQSMPQAFVDGKPNILLVSPILVEEPYHYWMAKEGSPCTHEESLKFWQYYKAYGEDAGVTVINGADFANPKPEPEGDGIHLDAEGHKIFAEKIAVEIQKLL